MSEEIDRSAALIERLLSEPDLRQRFLADPTSVLDEHGLAGIAAELGHGHKALMTLELRESRSSLAGVMVAAAAEAVDFAHVAGRDAPGLIHDTVRAVEQMNAKPKPHAEAARHAAAEHAAATPAPARDELPGLAAPPAAHPAPAASAGTVGASTAPATSAAPTPAGSAPAGSGSAASGSAASGSAASGSAGPAAAVTGRLGTGHAVGAPSHAAAAGAGNAGAGSGGTGSAHHDQPAGGVLDAPPTDQPDPLAYPGDSATPQQIAAWMGAHAAKAGLPPELPVMAALTESGLRNLTYGDRDSVGFFQMRLGIWNEGPYTGYETNPQLQIQWFIDHAVAVKAQYPGLAQNPGTWGEMVADVEQPAAEYRYRYQLQLGMAQELLHGANLTPAPPAPPIPLGQAALKVALTQLQTTAAGSSGAQGLNGAGLVQMAFAHEGVQLPRAAVAQFDVGMPVGPADLKLGDAVFFKDPSGNVSQVGLYVGSGRFVTAPDQAGQAKILSLSDPAYAHAFAGARRYTVEALGNPSSYARPLPTVGG